MAPSESGPPSWKESGGPFGGSDAPYAWGDSAPGTPRARIEGALLVVSLAPVAAGIVAVALYALYALGLL
jgi:hypothetical protein